MQHGIGSISVAQAAASYNRQAIGPNPAQDVAPRPEPELVRLGHRFEARSADLMALAARVEDLAGRLGLPPPDESTEQSAGAPTAAAPTAAPSIGTVGYLHDIAERIAHLAARISLQVDRLERL